MADIDDEFAHQISVQAGLLLAVALSTEDAGMKEDVLDIVRRLATQARDIGQVPEEETV